VTVSSRAFEGYSYRTSSRYGSRVTVSVNRPAVAITGPRIDTIVYRLWTGTQGVVSWLIVPALLAAMIAWDWRYLVLADLLQSTPPSWA
jgi:hypothetical protein